MAVWRDLLDTVGPQEIESPPWTDPKSRCVVTGHETSRKDARGSIRREFEDLRGGMVVDVDIVVRPNRNARGR